MRLVGSIVFVLKRMSGDLNSNVFDEVPDLDAEEGAEKVKENWSLYKGYKWVNYHVWEYFSKYRCSLVFRSYVAIVDVYDPSVTEDIVAFWHCLAIDNIVIEKKGRQKIFITFTRVC